jgi:hypothetical protein
VLRRVDAVTVPVGDLNAGMRFYGGVLGHLVKWRNDAVEDVVEGGGEPLARSTRTSELEKAVRSSKVDRSSESRPV